MSHTCHVPACKVVVPPKFLMCRKHWNMVPKAVQSRVWLYYRPGQEEDKNPSPTYLQAAKAAVAAVEDIEPHLCRECAVDCRSTPHHIDCPTRQSDLFKPPTPHQGNNHA